MFEDDVDDRGIDDIDEEASALANAFQRDYEDDHSWEQLQEDEHGRLVAVDTGGARAKRRRLLDAAASARIRRGLIRYVTVVLDLSQAATITDMRGSRAAAMATVAQRFIRDFFDQNPLSHLSLSLMRRGTAERLTELSGSPEAHVAKLKGQLDAEGPVSLQNALMLCMDALKAVPPYGHREVLILLAALSTCDPGNILDTIAAAKQAKVRVSVIGLAADVHICDKIAQETGGTYTVALNEQHLAELALKHSPPPPSRPSDASASLVRMGFPSRKPPLAGVLVGEACERAPGGFVCPRCRALVVDLPCSCHVCGLTLVSSPHLARSYHHLFPVPAYKEVTADASAAADGVWEADEVTQQFCGPSYCYGCMRGFAEGEASLIEDANAFVNFRSACPQCRCTFCFDCDTFIHETLHNCPGCENGPASRHQTGQEEENMEA